jgi:acyl CoA:acetate/3-ketoacid CoA transferase alpha subunit/acyl CoA:acetate/3-ketoacid CoA transferase beta subunit
MDPDLQAWIDRRFAVPSPAGSKVMSLREAVDTIVRPGDAIHLGMTHARFSAGFYELVRRFAGTNPGFDLLAVQMTTPLAPLVHASLAKKIVTSWSGDSYWTPGPNAVYQRVWREGLPFEHWSILTFPQRLAAAARGYATTTTRSLAGSSIADDNGLRANEDGEVVIPALVPDVSILHAPAADAQGNVLFSPPLFEGVWGAIAARRGAIVTVERIVDQSFVRAHAHMTRLPSSAVAAVVEAPMGAHPGGLLPTGIEGIEGYAEDYAFWVELRQACRDPGSMDDWIKTWILEPDSHAGFLERLGRDRLATLKQRTTTEPAIDVEGLDAPPNAIEWAIVAAARELRARVAAEGHTAMLAGAGMANLAAWLAAYDLAAEGRPIDLCAEMGLVGYWPRPGEPILFNQRNFPTCTMLTDIETTLGVLIGGARARSIGALGAAQVDKVGNINSTLVPGEYLLMGSGGANDVITLASESVVLASQSAERFLDRVPYVTGPGDRVRALVSTLGVYRKDQGELVLTAVFGDDPDEAVQECRARCGWDLKVARTLEPVPSPTAQELRTLRVIDPRGWFRA